MPSDQRLYMMYCMQKIGSNIKIQDGSLKTKRFFIRIPWDQLEMNIFKKLVWNARDARRFAKQDYQLEITARKYLYVQLFKFHECIYLFVFQISIAFILPFHLNIISLLTVKLCDIHLETWSFSMERKNPARQKPSSRHMFLVFSSRFCPSF